MTNDGCWTSVLNPDSPRYAEWHAILGGDKVELKWPLDNEVMLAGERVRPAGLILMPYRNVSGIVWSIG